MGNELREALRFLEALRNDEALRADFLQVSADKNAETLLQSFALEKGFSFDTKLLAQAFDVELRLRRAAFVALADGQSSPNDK